MGHNHRHRYFRTLGDRPVPVLLSYNFLLILRVDDMKLIFKNLDFTRLILELEAKETLGWLVETVGIC